ncbi:uncharacterized protein LOC117168185 [Belonocnema kinseyi]|uniref:uncharacterized protein LOC117168185 n=1 Tax=Belonocnema kinseyi TaxID=2817044 RepID=UPI00143E0988|nr:uncharacterized protein LOC117168185 [Belonocnema kinseyi]
MQPMNVSLFHPLKTKYRDAVRQWRIENDGALLTKVHFAGVLKSVLDSLDLVKIFGNGFKRCGLSPFSEHAIICNKLLKIDDRQVEVQKEQTYCEPNVEVSSTSDQNNSFFECHLDADFLTKLKSHDDSIEWTGSAELKELYKFWLRCQQSVPRMLDQSVTDTGFGDQNDSISTRTIDREVIKEILEERLNKGCSLSEELYANGNLIVVGPSDSFQETASDENVEVSQFNVELNSANTSINLENMDIVMDLSCDESKMNFSQDVKDRRLSIDDVDIPSAKTMDIDVETSSSKFMDIDGSKRN